MGGRSDGKTAAVTGGDRKKSKADAVKQKAVQADQKQEEHIQDEVQNEQSDPLLGHQYPPQRGEEEEPPGYAKSGVSSSHPRAGLRGKCTTGACPSASEDLREATERTHDICSSRRALQLEIKRRSTMASVVLKSLSILLGIFFIFVGTTKLTPRVSRELYKDLRKEFARYAKVFPLAQTLEFKVPSKWYRRGVGALEILCGICLTFIPSQRVKQGANLTLVLLMLFATYNHWMVGDKFERIAPSLVFFFMLTCRLIVEYQIKRKEKMEQKEKEEKLAKQVPQPHPSQQQQPLLQQQQQPQQPAPVPGKGSSSGGKEGKPHTGGHGSKAKKDD